jgi:FixJ family two-component response regulator
MRDLHKSKALGENPSVSEAGIVFVVDDDVAVREAIASLVRSVRLEVRTFDSAQEFAAALPLDGPGCLVLDVRLPGSSGLDLQRDLRARDVRLPIIFLTGYGDVPMTVRAMRAGAIEFLIKPFRDQDLLDAIQRGLEQSRAEHLEQLELAELMERYESLTPRECQVMAEVVAGLPNKKIAAEFGTSEATIKLQRSQVMQKMRAGSLAELVRLAARLSGGRAPS